MKNNYKFLLIILVVIFIVPQIALAAWWNPFSWEIWNGIFHKQNIVVSCEDLMKKVNLLEREQNYCQTNSDCVIPGYDEQGVCGDCFALKNKNNDSAKLKKANVDFKNLGCRAGLCEPCPKRPLESSIKCENRKCVYGKDETTNWKTYKNDKYGFEFKYPASWSFSENTIFSEKSGIKLTLSYRVRGPLDETVNYCTANPIKDRCENTTVQGKGVAIDWQSGVEKAADISIYAGKYDVGIFVTDFNDTTQERSVIRKIISTFKFTNINSNIISKDENNMASECRVLCGGAALPAGEAEFCGSQKTKEACQNKNHICEWVLKNTPACSNYEPSATNETQHIIKCSEGCPEGYYCATTNPAPGVKEDGTCLPNGTPNSY